MNANHTQIRREVLASGLADAIAAAEPFDLIDGNERIAFPEALGDAADFAQWDLAAITGNHRDHGEPWPRDVYTFEPGDGRLVVIVRGPVPHEIDDDCCRALAEVELSGLPIISVYRTECGRVAAILLEGTRAEFVARREAAEKGGVA